MLFARETREFFRIYSISDIYSLIRHLKIVENSLDFQLF